MMKRFQNLLPISTCAVYSQAVHEHAARFAALDVARLRADRAPPYATFAELRAASAHVGRRAGGRGLHSSTLLAQRKHFLRF
jgi:hypothetical protein